MPDGPEIGGGTRKSKEIVMADKWWFNSRTSEVEHGPQSLSVDRLGPFDTREEAERAPQKLQENAQRWAAEDAAADQD